MANQLERSELLIGKFGMEKLKSAKVAIFGLGGVGGYTAEALARSGIGIFHLVDKDVIHISNINRQIIATHDTIGRYKVDVMKERILSINPYAIVHTYPCFFLPEESKQFDFKSYSYIVDAMDTVTAKLQLAVDAKAADTPIISCMGAGNKLDPTKFQVGDIYKTKVCPLAKVMRRELKKRNISSLKVVYSTEEPIKPLTEMIDENRRSTPGSVAFVPSVAGLIIAGEVIKDIIK